MATPARLHVAAAPRIVDLETLYEVLVLSSAERASELQDWAVDATHKLLERWTEAQEARPSMQDAVPRLWRWLQLKLRADGTLDKAELLPLSRPVVFPLRLEHMDFIAGSFDDVKTELQLINGALSGLEEKLEQSQKKLEQLQEQMKRRPTCCSGSTTKTSTDKTLSAEKKVTSSAPLSRLSNETTALQVERLELPITLDRDVLQTSIAETSAALLEEILEGAAFSSEALNGRLSDDPEPPHPTQNGITVSTGSEITLSAQQHTSGAPKTTNLTHDQDGSSPNELPSLSVFQLYQVLARGPEDVTS